MKMADIVAVNVPLYQELNVADVLEMFKEHAELKRHLPDRMAKGRQIDRTYFFTVLNTLEAEKLAQIIAHAQTQRNVAQDEETKLETIRITESWLDELKEIPFKSSKYSSITNKIRGTWQDNFPSQTEGEGITGIEKAQKGLTTSIQDGKQHASRYCSCKADA